MLFTALYSIYNRRRIYSRFKNETTLVSYTRTEPWKRKGTFRNPNVRLTLRNSGSHTAYNQILGHTLKNTYGEYRYKELGIMTFPEAESQCKKIGGTLPIPRSGMIQKWLR